MYVLTGWTALCFLLWLSYFFTQLLLHARYRKEFSSEWTRLRHAVAVEGCKLGVILSVLGSERDTQAAHRPTCFPWCWFTCRMVGPWWHVDCVNASCSQCVAVFFQKMCWTDCKTIKKKDRKNTFNIVLLCFRLRTLWWNKNSFWKIKRKYFQGGWGGFLGLNTELQNYVQPPKNLLAVIFIFSLFCHLVCKFVGSFDVNNQLRLKPKCGLKFDLLVTSKVKRASHTGTFTHNASFQWKKTNSFTSVTDLLTDFLCKN